MNVVIEVDLSILVTVALHERVERGITHLYAYNINVRCILNNNILNTNSNTSEDIYSPDYNVLAIEKRTILTTRIEAQLYTARRVAMYLEKHCNIGSNTAFTTSVLDRWHNCLLIYWRTTCLVSAFVDT